MSALRPLVLLALGALTGCAPTSLTLPTKPPLPQPNPSVSLQNNGSIFRAGSSILLFEDLAAYRVGDVLTVEIAENLSSSLKQDAVLKKDSSITAKGSGATDDMGGLLKKLFNMDLNSATTTKTDTKDEVNTTQSLTGNITVSVIDVRSTGILTVAGEKQMRTGGVQTSLRFSGLVNRRDIRQGNVVSSKKVADARIERVGEGVIADPGTLTFMQRLFMSVMDL